MRNEREEFEFWPHQWYRLCLCVGWGIYLQRTNMRVYFRLCMYANFPPIQWKQTESGSCGEGELSWQQLEKRMIQKHFENVEILSRLLIFLTILIVCHKHMKNPLLPKWYADKVNSVCGWHSARERLAHKQYVYVPNATAEPKKKTTFIAFTTFSCSVIFIHKHADTHTHTRCVCISCVKGWTRFAQAQNFSTSSSCVLQLLLLSLSVVLVLLLFSLSALAYLSHFDGSFFRVLRVKLKSVVITRCTPLDNTSCTDPSLAMCRCLVCIHLSCTVSSHRVWYTRRFFFVVVCYCFFFSFCSRRSFRSFFIFLFTTAIATSADGGVTAAALVRFLSFSDFCVSWIYGWQRVKWV